jgi:GMP synthase (glutamine-hydrolysing)
MIEDNRILILDFGSQVTQLIARRVRESGTYCEIYPYNRSDEQVRAFQPKGIILSGGPASTLDSDSPRAPQIVWDLGIPVLAICYGQQSMCMQLGGKVEGGHSREFGKAIIEIKETCDLYNDFWPYGSKQQVWMSHGDRVTKLPTGFRVTATSEGAPFAFIVDEKRRFYGTMFHPEVIHTIDGAKLLSNFVHKICGCPSDWSMKAFRASEIERIRKLVGKGKVLCGLSGGVDSAVAAVLIHEAIGDQLTCVFVDTGMMRQGEAEQVVSLFRSHYNIPLIAVNAADQFLTALKNVTDPEQKRKAIGKLFIDVFDEAAHKIQNVEFLSQGTLYPDVIESISFTGGPSVTIKSHHNVGGLPERMNLKLIEPLRELFKDEVRVLGRELGLPEGFVKRHPFPGPGLAIRILGEISEDRLQILRKADAVYLDEIHKAGLYDDIWQAFAILLPVKTVGVMGDGRSYDYVLALRAVTSVDGMTAESYPFDHAFLARVATRIINEVKGINRVTYDVTSKPPGTIEWE